MCDCRRSKSFEIGCQRGLRSADHLEKVMKSQYTWTWPRDDLVTMSLMYHGLDVYCIGDQLLSTNNSRIFQFQTITLFPGRASITSVLTSSLILSTLSLTLTSCLLSPLSQLHLYTPACCEEALSVLMELTPVRDCDVPLLAAEYYTSLPYFRGIKTNAILPIFSLTIGWRHPDLFPQQSTLCKLQCTRARHKAGHLERLSL